MRAGSIRRRRILRVVAIVIVVLAMVFVTATCLLFIWPATDEPGRVDAIVALAGDQHRAHYALELAHAGHAPIAVISLGGYSRARCPHPVPNVRIICFRPNPVNTRGEAEYVSALAARHGWKRLIIVPEMTQTTRARLLFARCTTAQLRFVPVGDPLTHIVLDVVYEWGALAKALVVKPTC